MQLAEHPPIIKALKHGRGLRQSSALQHAIRMTAKTSALVERKDTVNEAHEPTHPFVDVIVLQLNEASADGSNVALLIGEGHAACSLWVFELWVGVDAGVANTSVQPVHDHSQLHWREEEKERGRMISATVGPLRSSGLFFCPHIESPQPFLKNLVKDLT